MNTYTNKEGAALVSAMIAAISREAQWLSELDGVIGDGDHGINMNKGFQMASGRLDGTPWTLTQGLEVLGKTLLDEIGGAMGPLYGCFFAELAEASQGVDPIGASEFDGMLSRGLTVVKQLGAATVGDKTLVDTLEPAAKAFAQRHQSGGTFMESLEAMIKAAERGRDSTIDLVARVGRSSRLGDRSRGVLDAGAASCFVLLNAMAESSKRLLKR